MKTLTQKLHRAVPASGQRAAHTQTAWPHQCPARRSLRLRGGFAALLALLAMLAPALPARAQNPAPSVGRNTDGRLEVFDAATNGPLSHNWQTFLNPPWSGWDSSLGGSLRGDAVAVSEKDGRLDVFARAYDNAIWHISQTGTRTRPFSWNGWVWLDGNVLGDATVGRNRDGRLEVFARAVDRQLWHTWQIFPGANLKKDWFPFQPLYGLPAGVFLADDPVVASNADGHMEVFARGTDNALWHIKQIDVAPFWTPWQSLGGFVKGKPVVGMNEDGRLEVFYRGGGGNPLAYDYLYHIWQTRPGGPYSGQGSDLEGEQLVGDPAVGRNKDGRLEVFVRIASGGYSTGQLGHNWQDGPNGGWLFSKFYPWDLLSDGDVDGNPAVASNADGRLEVFFRGRDIHGAKGLLHTWQAAPSSGPWSRWTNIDLGQ